MEGKRLRNLAPEIFKTLNHLKTTNLTHRPLDIKVDQDNITKYGTKSLRSLGPSIWNSLPKLIKEKN